MPWQFALALVALFALYILADAMFDVSKKISAAWTAWRAKRQAAAGQIAAAPESANENAPAPARKRVDLTPLVQLASVLAVLLGLWVVVDRFTTSPGEVRERFAADTARAGAATHDAEAQRARKYAQRVETHAVDQRRLEQELAHARQSIADAPDLEARADAARAHLERMRDDAEAARAAALRAYDAGQRT